MSREELERDRPLQLKILRLVHHTHATLAELGEDLVVTDCPADYDSPILP